VKLSRKTMAAKTRYSATDIDIEPLNLSEDLSDFSCGNIELDDFFHKEVVLCCRYKYLTAYAVRSIKSGEIIGLFTLSNDIVSLDNEDIEDLKEGVGGEYKYIFGNQSSFPAVNIGHLAIKKNLQSKGIGRLVILYICHIFIQYRFTGVQFITVDSLNNPRTNKFYAKNRFLNQSNRDINQKTRRMYLSLMDYIE
jgi:hypothetical protein